MSALRRILLLAAAALTGLMPPSARAASVLLTVTDPSNAVIPNAQVRLRPVGQPLPREATFTNYRGEVALDAPLGRYDLFVAYRNLEPHSERIALQRENEPKTIVLRPIKDPIFIEADSPRLPFGRQSPSAAPPTVAITFSVRESGGLPIAKAWVAGAETDADGTANVRFQQSRVPQWIAVVSAGYRPWHGYIMIQPETPRRIEFILEDTVVAANP